MVVYFKDWTQIETYEDPRFGITGLTPAEKELKRAVAKGQPCILGKVIYLNEAKYLPPKPKDWSKLDPTRHIRADVLRFVLLQKPKHDGMTEFGTQIYGALVTGTLNLANTTIPALFGLIACRFAYQVMADKAQFQSNVFFRYSKLPALLAMGAKFNGQLSCSGASFEFPHGVVLDLQSAEISDGLFLDGVTAKSTIQVSGATIKGQLNCEGASFEGTREIALNLQGAEIGNAVFLRGVTAMSTIDINGATIKGELACEGASFGSKNGKALNLHGAKILNGIYFLNIKSITGYVILTAAYARILVDDAESWAKTKNLTMDGFRYDSISVDAKLTFGQRIEWLEKGSIFRGVFSPQPYTQLADTYKRAGHERQARVVRVALARKLAKEDWYETHERWMERELLFEARYPLGEWIGRFLHKCVRLSVTTSKSCWNWLFRNVVGYGYKPFNSLWFLLGLIVAAWILAYSAWHEGQFAPNSAPILVSQDWLNIKDDPMAAVKWSEPYDKVENPHGGGGQDWETFNSFAYAADIVIPIVEIGQTSAWAPSPARGAWGWTLWWTRWVFTAAGWIISALGAAAITGVIRRE